LLYTALPEYSIAFSNEQKSEAKKRKPKAALFSQNMLSVEERFAAEKKISFFLRFVLTKSRFYSILPRVTNSNAVVVEFGRHASLRC
jgi:hypothetical protein